MGMFDSLYARGRAYQGLFVDSELQTKELGLVLARIDLTNGVPKVVDEGTWDSIPPEDLEPLENGEIEACQWRPKYNPYGKYKCHDLVRWTLTFASGKLVKVQYRNWPRYVVTFTTEPVAQAHPLRRIARMCYLMNLPRGRSGFTKHVMEIVRRHGIDAAHRYMDKKGLLRVYDYPEEDGIDIEFSDVVPQEEREAAMTHAFAMAWNAQTLPLPYHKPQ